MVCGFKTDADLNSAANDLGGRAGRISLWRKSVATFYEAGTSRRSDAPYPLSLKI